MTPSEHLPPPIDPETITNLLTSLALPAPTAITPLQVTADFHTIYLITYTSPPASIALPSSDPDGSITLVLRISGTHVPHIKTMNEVAIMTWLQRHTSIPVPRIIHHDTTSNNILAREFTLLEKIPGQSIDKLYPTLSEDIKIKLVDQLIDMLVELNAHSWQHIGGLQIIDGEMIPGPLLEDTFWFTPDIQKQFGPSESVSTLNPLGPYFSHADFINGYIDAFIRAVQLHDSLAWMRDIIPRLEKLNAKAHELDLASNLILAHKDLHFANIMATPDGQITGILDWEFAGIVPSVRWDPVRAFLWSGAYSQDAHEEKMRLRTIFEAQLKRRGQQKWWEEGVGEHVESVWEVIRFVRAIVEVCPRGEKEEQSRAWRESVETALTKLGV